MTILGCPGRLVGYPRLAGSLRAINSGLFYYTGLMVYFAFLGQFEPFNKQITILMKFDDHKAIVLGLGL